MMCVANSASFLAEMWWLGQICGVDRCVVCFSVLPVHRWQSSVPAKQLPDPRLELDPTSQPVLRENRWREVRVYASSSLLAHRSADSRIASD